MATSARADAGQEAARRAHYDRMTRTPVTRLVTRLAIPTIVSMLVTSIYNMADTFFVSQLGTSASGAVGVVFSLMALIQAIGFMIGMGSGNLTSRHLGARHQEQAEQAASSGFFLSLAAGTVLAVLGLAFLEPLMGLMGATPTIQPYAQAYARYILYAAPVMCGSFVMNNILRGEGKAVLAMVGIGVGGLLNVVLDPLFIFTFGLGTAGAAIATALSQLVSFFILLGMFLAGKSSVRLRLSRMARRPRLYGQILAIGLPSFCRQGIASVSTMLLNQAAAVYGDAAVAAMSITGRVFQFLFNTNLGFSQGYQPVCSFNYGAGLYGRVRQATFFTVKVCTALLLVSSAVCFVFAPEVVALFRADDAAVIEIGSLAFRLQCLALPVLGFTCVCNMALQNTGHAWQATVLSACRQGICFVPLILTLPRWMGLLGVQAAQPLADVLSAVVNVPFWVWFLRKLRREEQAARADGQEQEDAG